MSQPLQDSTRNVVTRRRSQPYGEQQRHSWAGCPNPVSGSVLKLAKGERLSWMGVVSEMPVIPEDKNREKDKDSETASKRAWLDVRLSRSSEEIHQATSALGSRDPHFGKDPSEDEDGATLDPSKKPQLLGEEGKKRSSGRTKVPFKRRISPPTSSFNPWVLQPQQLRQKLEYLQQEQGGASKGPHPQNGNQVLMHPNFVVVDIFDDSKEVFGETAGSNKQKMPQDSTMDDDVFSGSVSVNNSNMDATYDPSSEIDEEMPPGGFVRSVPKTSSGSREALVDSRSNGSSRTGKHERTTNNNRRSLSPQAREYVSRLHKNGAIGKPRAQSLRPGGDNEEQMNGFRQRKKSLALALNEGRLEMKEVRMRPLDIETDFHLIAQLNQLNRELMDLSKSGSSTSPSSPTPNTPAPNASHSFSSTEESPLNSVLASDRRTSGPLSPIMANMNTRTLPLGDSQSSTPSRKGRSPAELRHQRIDNEDSSKLNISGETSSRSTSSTHSSLEQKVITESAKETKSVSPREVLSRIKLRLSSSKLSRHSPQRSSASKVEIQILRPNQDGQGAPSGEKSLRRATSLKHDSDVRRTWPNMEGYSENCEDTNSPSPAEGVGQSPVYRRINSDGPLDRQRKRPILPEENPLYLPTLDHSHHAPGSSTDSGLGKDQRHSKSSADSLLEDFPISSPVSSRGNSNPPSRPMSSDIADLSWEKGQEVSQVRRGKEVRRFLSKSMPQSPAFHTPTQGSTEDLLEGPMSMPGSHEDLLGGRDSRIRASGSSHGSSIGHAALQTRVKPPKPRHRPIRRSKTDLGDPKIIKAALTLAKMQGGEETPKAEKTPAPSTSKKRPTSALGISGVINSTSGRESPSLQPTAVESKPSPLLQRSRTSTHPAPKPLLLNINPADDPDAAAEPPLTPLRRSRSLGSAGTLELPDTLLRRRAQSMPSGLGDEEQMLSDPDLSKINARMSETFDQFFAATLAEALFDHVTMDGTELTFQAGDVVEITDMTDSYWWWGCIDKQEGWLPAPFVRLKVSQGETVEECISRLSQDNTAANQQGGLSATHEPLMRKVSLSFLSNDEVRANVIREIITTERDYVRNLANISEGYIEQARSRPDMFSDALRTKLFCNIEDIHSFQMLFLADLETCINIDMPHLSAIGACFLKYKNRFNIYGEYCNNYPHAISELQDLMKDNKYVQFFEACRLLQAMIQISLDGFLLTPVQKICKYPLQLNELLKYTRPQHPDYEPLKGALDAMREVAQSINERKRRIEHIENIALWQKNIGDWEGDDVLDRSSMLIYSDEVARVSLTGRHRTSPRQLFLFDHQLIICRKDILRRDVFVYKDRIDLDDCQIEDLPDGKENDWNLTLRYAWKIQNFEDPPKVYVFMCRNRKEKKRWLRHFGKERKIVHEGLTRGSSFMAAKEAALKSTTNNTKPSKPSDRVTVRRALSMPHRKVREARDTAIQVPRTPPPEPEPDTPKRKSRSLFGFQVGKK
ncbi:uncharacterized protein [Diadema antillarum]|uniref:uncharacterized protein n=1 Tax=Diadema antillarum TaxID=105358 RepID=UPI003A85774D